MSGLNEFAGEYFSVIIILVVLDRVEDVKQSHREEVGTTVRHCL